MSTRANRPVATVVIPTHNRRDELRRALKSIERQTVPVEVFVFDDASTDESFEMVKEEFPNVTVERSEVSRGPTFHRNEGARRAATPFLFTIDDDCELAEDDTVEQTVAAFDDPRVGAVTIPFINVLQEDKSVRTAAPDETDVWIALDFFGGMVALRVEAFLAVGGYRPYYFIQVEEPDLAIRMMNRGWVVRLGTCAPMNHYESPSRAHSHRNQQGPRNNVLYAWYNVPTRDLPVQLLGTTVNAARRAARDGYLRDALRGIARGYAGCVHELTERSPVDRGVYRLSRRLRRDGRLRLDEAAPLLSRLDSGSRSRPPLR